jgi:hypothetical protein
MRGGARFGRVAPRLLAALVPILLMPAVVDASVRLLARRGAALLWSLSSGLPATGLVGGAAIDAQPRDVVDLPSLSSVASNGRESAVVTSACRQRAGRRSIGPGDRRNARRIYVGPDLVRRAVPATGRPVAAWTSRTDEHPAGMLISDPGALAGTLRAGDVLYEAEGHTLASFEQLVAIVGQAYQRGARIVSGRLWRRGEPWVITVEPGWTKTSSSGER